MCIHITGGAHLPDHRRVNKRRPTFDGLIRPCYPASLRESESLTSSSIPKFRAITAVATTITLCGGFAASRLALGQETPARKVPRQGFRAESETKADDAPTHHGTVEFDHSKLRINQGHATSSIVDLETGDFTLLVHAHRVFAHVSVKQMKAQREEARHRALEHIRTLPPQTQRLMRAQMAQQDEALAQPVTLTATGQVEVIDGVRCNVTTWSSPEEQGRACLATKAAIPLDAFRAAGQRFGERLRRAGLGTRALSLPLLVVAPFGFPMRIKETIRIGPAQITSTTRYRRLRVASIDRARFSPPSTYRRLGLPELTRLLSKP